MGDCNPMLCPIHVFRPELYARDPVAKPVNHRIHNLLLREFVFLAWLLDFWVILREYRSTMQLSCIYGRYVARCLFLSPQCIAWCTVVAKKPKKKLQSTGALSFWVI